ncbi:YgfZ/GcvT domain-containing protein [Pseudomonadota bacterium]
MEALDYLKTAHFTGEEAEGFLQAQLSADISELQPGNSTFACYCSPRGQVYGLLLVCRTEDEFLVSGSADLLPGMLQRLRMFVFRTRVEFALDETRVVYGLQAQDPASDNQVFTPGATGLRYMITEPHLDVSGGGRSFRAREMINQVSWLSAETTEKFIPQMLGYDQLGAVSFTKGCYPGQEIVARAHYLGKVKRKPVILTVKEELSVAALQRVELNRDEAWVKGTVIDSVIDDQGSTYLFAIAPADPEGPVSQFKLGEQVYRCATT